MPATATSDGWEGKYLGDEQFLRKVASLHLEGGYSQEAIGQRLSLPRAFIGRALQRARDRGLVRTSIRPDPREGYLRPLARDVRRVFGLHDVVLVSGRAFDSLGGGATLGDVVGAIARAAAEYLDQALADTDILAVSGGRTFVRNVVSRLRPSRTLPHLRVVSTIGFVEARPGVGEANLVAFDIAQAYQAAHVCFCIPAFLPPAPVASPEVVTALYASLPITREAMELSEDASVYLLGLWTPHTNDDVVRRGILSWEQIEAVESYRPVADINHWAFDEEGRCINELMDPLPYSLTGFAIPRLKQKIARGAQVILVAGGGPAYVPAIRAILRAGLVSVLVTDHVTALQLGSLA